MNFSLRPLYLRLGVGLASVLTGCAPQIAYQVLQTRPELAHTPANSALELTYDFWHPGGQVGAILTNTSNGPIYVDLNRAHLIVNGTSYEYYTDSEVSTTATVGTAVAYARNPYLGRLRGAGAVGASAASSSSLVVRPKPVLEIPPAASVPVRLMTAIGGPVMGCELDKFDSRRTASVEYDSVSTPLRFRMYFTYSRQPDLAAPEVLDVGFRVEKITAMMGRSFAGPGTQDKDPCTGKKLMTYSSSYPFAGPDRLYIRFSPLTYRKLDEY